MSSLRHQQNETFVEKLHVVKYMEKFTSAKKYIYIVQLKESDKLLEERHMKGMLEVSGLP